MHEFPQFLMTKSGFAFTNIVFAGLFLVSYLCLSEWQIGAIVYKFRYVIAVGLLIISVLLSLSGSSIGMWGKSLPEGSTSGLLMGTPRSFRTDEWALFTPMVFAQFLDPQGTLPYFGEVFRGIATDMYIIYGQPVWDVAMIFRPFQWGYLLLGLERGLAFFWASRLIVLFMATFELGMLLTEKSKSLSVSLAAMVSFAPVVQWWFSINSFVEMIVFTEIIVLSLLKFFNTKNVAIKCGLCLLLVISTGGFALTLYPAWEMPMAWLVFFLVIGIFLHNRENLHFECKKDAPILCAGVIALLAGMVHIYLKSEDTISAVINTAYPGQRVGTGGGGLLMSLRYPVSYFLPYIRDAQTLSTGVQDSATMFFDLFPLGIMLALWVILKQRVHDSILISLLIPTTIIGLYCFVGFPEWLATATLLGHSITSRALVVFSLLNLLILFRTVPLLKALRPTKAALVATAVTGIVILGVYYCEPKFLDWTKLLFLAVVLMIGIYGFLRCNIKLIVVFSCLTALICGFAVNPLQRGISVVADNKLIQEVRSIVKNDPNAKWFNAVGWQSNVTTLAGAKTINATNTYPNTELWKVLDLDSSHQETWNRYAHIHATVDKKQTTYKLNGQDLIQLNISLRDLKRTGAKYVLVNDSSSKSSLEADFDFIKIRSIDGWDIYMRDNQ